MSTMESSIPWAIHSGNEFINLLVENTNVRLAGREIECFF